MRCHERRNKEEECISRSFLLDIIGGIMRRDGVSDLDGGVWGATREVHSACFLYCFSFSFPLIVRYGFWAKSSLVFPSTDGMIAEETS